MRISDWSSDVCSSDLTLENPGAEDFWWLNNGVTILAQEASQVGKTIKITDPQIINGLQTSTEILTFFGTIDSNDTRPVLIKIVQSTSPETRDKVLQAPNRHRKTVVQGERASVSVDLGGWRMF